MTTTLLPRALPGEKGADAQGILTFLQGVKGLGLEFHSFMVYCRGAVIAEAHWHPYHAGRLHVQHSATKSWTAAGIGLLVDDGLLSLDDRVVSFFPEECPAHISENLAAMTVLDLLTMRTGHQQGISGGAWRGRSDSWVKAFLQEPVPDRPGEKFIYSSGSSFMLSAIATVVTGKTLHEICERRLFNPMGMGELTWDLSPGGFNTGGNGLTCSIEDSLKFGVLHLNRGEWNGQQLLSENWISDATANQVAEAWLGRFDGKRYMSREESGEEGISRREGYGYQWWMTQHGGYYASGVFGQKCMVFPEYDAVIAITSGLPLDEKRVNPLIWQHLLPALKAGKVTGDSIDQELAGFCSLLKFPLIKGQSDSPARGSLSGQFFIEPNVDQIISVSFSFTAEKCHFALSDDRGTHTIEVGLFDPVESQTSMTGHYLHHAYQPPWTPVVAHGRWTSPNTFEMDWRFVETAFDDRVVCRIENDVLHLDRSVNVNAGPTRRPTITGKRIFL